MRRLLLGTGVVAVLALGGAARAGLAGSPAGPDPFIFYFDEWGNGYTQYNNYPAAPGPKLNNPGIVAPDPTGRVAGNVLYYNLPELVVQGDIVVNEPGGTGAVSDILSFRLLHLPTGDKGIMIFYSDPGEGAPADTGFPGSGTLFNVSTITETGPEGANSFDWYPGGLANNIYHGKSDGFLVPTPAAVLGALPLLGMMAAGRRRRV